MAHVRYSRVIDAPIADVWAIVRDFGTLDSWFPFVSQCRLKDEATAGQVGAVRVNTTTDGAVIEETLLELSDRDHRIVYSVTKGDVPTKDYSATLALHEVTADGRTYADWSADFDVAGEIEPVASWVRQDIFATCLTELEQVAKRGGSQSRKDQASAGVPT